MDAVTYAIPAQIAYLHIPHAALRGFVDGLFPNLAKCGIADIAAGHGHRFRAGHDLFLDVSATLKTQGVGPAAHQAGHILATDFPTKAGIPIPFLSESGLGGWLTQHGIHQGWLCMNLMDTGIGIIAIANGSANLYAALSGKLPMTLWTAFNTFGIGIIEIKLSLCTHNPLLLIAGAENILAGLVSASNTLLSGLRAKAILLPIDPLQFFGAGFVSALIGFTISRVVLDEDMSEAALNALQSGALGALFAASLCCGLGAMAGYLAYCAGKALAQQNHTPYISLESVQAFQREIASQHPDIPRIRQIAERALANLNAPGQAEAVKLKTQFPAQTSFQMPTDASLLDVRKAADQQLTDIQAQFAPISDFDIDVDNAIIKKLLSL